jgi:hypothetical protein
MDVECSRSMRKLYPVGAAAALGLADELSRAFAYRSDRPYQV